MIEMLVLVVIIILWCACIRIGYLIGKNKNCPDAGIFYGLLLGPFGCFIALGLPDNNPLCAGCGKPVNKKHKKITKCKRCGTCTLK